MDDLAPAPTQRTSDEGGPRPEQSLVPRKKVPRKAPPSPLPAKEPDPDPSTERSHELDVLA